MKMQVKFLSGPLAASCKGHLCASKTSSMAPVRRSHSRHRAENGVGGDGPFVSLRVSTSSMGEGHRGGASARALSRIDVIYAQKVIYDALAESVRASQRLQKAAGGPRCTCMRNLYSRSVVGSRPGGMQKGTRCAPSSSDLAQRRGCPRNCKWRAFLDEPLEHAPGRSRMALSREPGDLPATQHVPGPRVEGIWSMI
jgi:hypothetical protein